jgi:hypothetical protein
MANWVSFRRASDNKAVLVNLDAASAIVPGTTSPEQTIIQFAGANDFIAIVVAERAERVFEAATSR